MEFENTVLKVKFTIPEPVTVRTQMLYDSARDSGSFAGRDVPMYERLWVAARSVVKDWECESTSLDMNMDDVTDPASAAVAEWTGLIVFSFMVGLASVPKNS